MDESKLPQYIKDKRAEFAYALDDQGYQPKQIQQILGFKHLSTLTRLLEKKPKDWKCPWVKAS